MQAGLWAFWAVFASISVIGTVAVYPGVRRHVPSRVNTVLAASMSASLFAAMLALAAGAMVNAVVLIFTGP